MADNIWTATVEGIAARGRANNGAEGDYRDEEGFLCCGKCRTRKEGDITIGEKTLRVPHLCKCESEASRQREAEEKAAEFRKQCERLRKDGITDPSYLSQNFTQDDNRNARISDVCRRYVEHWPEMKADNKVKVLKAVTYTGKAFKTYYDKYDVIEADGDRVVIGIGKTVTAAVNAANLIRVGQKIKIPADTQAAQSFKKGDKVKVLKAVTYTGKAFKTYYDKYDVIEADGDRVVIGIGKTVTAAVNAANLKKA